MPVPTPEFIPIPFAEDASGSYINYPIPYSPPATPPNAACWEDGFQSITMQPEISGGLPPFGQDFNGILNTLSQSPFALQAGQWYAYDGGFATSISGYATGALLAMEDGSGFWINTGSGNTNDPDDTGTPGYWVSLYSYGFGLVSTTGGTVTLTQEQWKRSIIRVQGALTSNATIVILDQVGEWLISNETTGSHTLTAVMSAMGASVPIPQSGIGAPTGVYCPDAGNLYATSITTAGLAPINSPTFTGIPQGPTPATSSDTTQLATTAFVKAVLAASPALGGNPTAVTQALGNSSTKIATTAFVNPGSLQGTNGWELRPSGIIEQWGTASYSGSGDTLSISFPRTFISACWNVVCCLDDGGFNAGVDAKTTSGWTADTHALVGTPVSIYWRAIGT